MVLNLVAASGYLSSLMGNPRVSRYLDRHHPEILAELKVVVAATSLEESGSDCRRNNPWYSGARRAYCDHHCGSVASEFALGCRPRGPQFVQTRPSGAAQ